MRILAVDVGTGTQDILLFDTSRLVENCVKMVMPSPTALVARRIAKATSEGRVVALAGSVMGGGPNKRALVRHLEKGLEAYATEDAALTFHDDLDVVRQMGVTLVSPDALPDGPDVEVIELRDVDINATKRALEALGVDSYFDAVAIAVLDHGLAPRGVSNRAFRFELLQQLLSRGNALDAFVFLAEELPEVFTRMMAVVDSAGMDEPLLVADTGVAAALGALRDDSASRQDDLVVLNLGNSHTIAFHLHGGSIEGFFEHHTNRLSAQRIDVLVSDLVSGELTNARVFEEGGHGAVVVRGHRCNPAVVCVGPRWDVMRGSVLGPYRAIPFGDTMLAGCYGLVAAWGLRREEWREEIEAALSQGR